MPEASPIPLLDEDQLSNLQIALHGEAGIDTLFSAAQANSSLLDRCLAEARSVLGGAMSARDRLWLLLRGAAGLKPISIPARVVEPSTDAPELINGGAVLDLIVGVVRSANSQPEANAMLAALGALLDPVFLLEHAARAHQNGQADVVQAIAAAAQAAAWGKQNNPAPPPHVTGIWENRVVFDTRTFSGGFDGAGTIRQYNWLWYCLTHHLGSSEIDPFAAPYHIDSISDPTACAGQTITIRGANFGAEGRVSFPAPNASDPAFKKYAGDDGILIGVTAVSWTDTQIDVVVPPWAISGDLHLNAFKSAVTPCATQDIYHLGNSIPFTGGLASVFAVNINGQPVDLNYPQTQTFAPNDTMVLSWQASVGPTVSVSLTIQDKFSGKQLWAAPSNFPGGFQAAIVTIPDPGMPTIAQFVLQASSVCGHTDPLTVDLVISVIPVLTVFFLEVTQGVQTDPAAQAQGGAMPLVEGKDTGVRVYLNCDRHGWFADLLNKVTGSLTVSGGGEDAITLAPINVRPSVPDQGYIDVLGTSQADQGFTTLNFLIPGPACTGSRTISVNVYSGSDPSGPVRVSASIQWTWIPRNVIRLRWIIVDPPALMYAPTADQLTAYLSSALDYLPTTVYDVGPAWTTQFNNSYDLTSNDGWNNLLDDLSSFKDCSVWYQLSPFTDHCSSADDGATWVGIVPPTVNVSGGELGLASNPGDTCVAVYGRPDVTAHEVGHTFGFQHVNLAQQGQSIPGPYDTVDNGGYHRRPAFDVHAGNALVRSPLQIDSHGVNNNEMTADLMSYFTPLWFTTTNWVRMFNML